MSTSSGTFAMTSTRWFSGDIAVLRLSGCPVVRFDDVEVIVYDRSAGWSSLVARWAHNPKVGGSNPPPATKPPVWFQWVEPIS
jgi:hypothetical protein